jgi:hypothetical protein
MSTKSDAPGASASLALIAHHTLALHRTPTADTVRLLTPDGAAAISITISAAGITLDVAGADLTLRTTGTLALHADHLSLHGEKGVAITTAADATIVAAGTLHTEARAQTLRATHGSVDVKANDDITLEGERIKLNP